MTEIHDQTNNIRYRNTCSYIALQRIRPKSQMLNRSIQFLKCLPGNQSCTCNVCVGGTVLEQGPLLCIRVVQPQSPPILVSRVTVIIVGRKMDVINSYIHRNFYLTACDI